MGGVVLTPASAAMLNQYSLEEVMPWLGFIFAAVVIPIAWFVVKDKPGVSDGLPDTYGQERGWSYRAAVRSKFFILLTAAYVLCMGSQVGGIAHLYNRVDELVDYRYAAYAVQALTIMSITGRFVGGWLVTRIAIRPFTLGNVLFQGLGLVLIATAASPYQTLAGAALFGACVGNLLMLQPLWLAEAFGLQAYARIFSFANAVTVAGVAIGPLLMGAVYDLDGYTSAYLGAAVVSAFALILMVLAGRGPDQANQPS
jgi:predicted MFS family arabinose efflux permease